ncbi:serine hydrolase domain-containing protein [Pseudomonas sp. RIT-PI-a]|uniref:serine hydrolase domain-containing protein n=1 Tax=Pseudomonas sp. RIT-PI-a TaxID=1681194 RepID=UPI00067697A6|nr:serine hydrolase [Pseudomonas sp. RIT-PI-a]KNC14472.1 beta-lactamase [Pseudomonas sp. RIT-PI-a]
MSRLFILSIFLLCSVSVGAQSWPSAQWSQALAPASPAIAELERYAFVPRDDVTREGVRTDALLVIRDGEIVYERYAGPGAADRVHATWSISKSLLATVMGVAYGEGRFALEDAAADYFQPLDSHRDIRVEDLLHWASGLDWEEDYEYAPLNSSVVAMLYTRGHQDMASYAASHRRAHAPGERFRYSSGDSNLLAAALRNMVGLHEYPDYPWQALFTPLGIDRAVWETDASGTFVASSYAYLTARDLARVGLLMQRDGEWQGRQLLPQAWVAFNRTPFAPSQDVPGEPAAGAHWWLNSNAAWPHAPRSTMAALGHWGQALYVLPEQRLVIVRYADDRDASFSHDALLQRLLAAFAPEGGQ